MGDLRINRRRPLAELDLRAPGIGHNGGPPLDQHIPEWGVGGIRAYFDWRAASEAAFKALPVETAIRRAKKAEALGLTFREYQLEILERGRYLQSEDVARIAEIKAKRCR